MEIVEGDPADVPRFAYNQARNQPASRMIHYAHTATQPDGTLDSDESKWELLRTHLTAEGLAALDSI